MAKSACFGCGKCCYRVVKYLDVELFKKDLKKIPLKLREFRNSKWWMKRKKNSDACIALNEKTNLCKIYSIRSEECRNFYRGHPVCKKIMEK